ncbi:protein S100-A5 isoform X1 [Mesoplodon densirostris]|uniref:protein S100-A5 isoform X1 n=1 Tax=Mesoplodon densirostris TaxID=48708 RepID=UPI0028DC3D6C|nr:protein S100-A5 isoform X1 [Mesoplodon densirostris]
MNFRSSFKNHQPPELHTMLETSLEKALTTMVTTFHKYSGREGSKLTLSRKELKELIEKDLCLGEKMKESSMDDLMKSLDKNGDQEIDFKEYSGTSLVAQWLRILLPMQGTRVRTLVREDPTCRGATKPGCHNY